MADSKQRSREDIDSQILSLKKRNELAPVSSLPAELLSKIFHLCTRKDIDPTQFKALAIITWVSARWRAIALDDPSLWSNVSPSFGTKWLAAFVQRSKPAPLSVSMNRHKHYLPLHHQVKALLSQISRITSITLVVADSTTVGDVLTAMASPALLLESLHIDLVFNDPHTALDKRGIVVNNLPLQAPRLRRVDFMDFAFPWNSSVYQTVTSLKMGFFNPAPPFKTRDLYQGIKAMAPHLQELQFDFSIDLEADATEYRPIALPRLEKIALKKEKQGSLCLLRLLHLPASTYLHLNCQWWIFDEVEFMCADISSSWVSGPLSKPSQPPIIQRLSMRVAVDPVGVLKIAGWRRYAFDQDSDEGKALEINAYPQALQDYRVTSSIILNYLPIQNVVALELEWSWASTIDLQQIFSRLPHLKEIKLCGRPGLAFSFASYILEDAQDTSEPTTAASLPSLKELHLERVYEHVMPEIIDRLSRALNLRRERGRACIVKLVVEKCGPLAESQLNQLKDGTGVEEVVCVV
ncbi:hypothetical protein BKA70DRAFT_1510014 [Coprinopsis sp. MPI-PUGE-AT-0042]|nr:hypothetical protein BKA70DRAFT_1510014 [Coprinopsis sp. MPI-PUGE-AT-0042]